MLSAVTFEEPGQKEKKKPMIAYIRPTMLATTPKRPNLHGPNRMASFNHLLRAMSAIGTMYEASTLATLRETIALKAVMEPILIRASSKLMTTVMPME